MGVLDTLYVVLVNANAFVACVEFSISYPPSLTWIADLDLPPIIIPPGSGTPTGIGFCWDPPRNGFTPIQILRVVVAWNCDTCEPVFLDGPIVVLPNPLTGGAYPHYTTWPDWIERDAIGMTALTCATVSTEETTWGKVKVLYVE
ncbi:MAG: hypothetical protein JSW58_03355 [Candidatus Latescibacterota bacterium]|nr:MAG: hypothetical protein JSW58_03355 [Candidatus Latescibacterota bacterium]